GDVKQITDTGHGARDRSGVGHVALGDLEPRIGEIRARARRADQHAQLFAGLQKCSRHRRTDKAAGAGNQDHPLSPFSLINNRYSLQRELPLDLPKDFDGPAAQDAMKGKILAQGEELALYTQTPAKGAKP